MPDGYVSLQAALDHHGRAMYGDAWTGEEAAARDSAARSWDISAAIHARHPNPSSELDDDYLPVGDLDLPEPDPAELAELEERHAAERQARARWEAAYLDLRRKMQSGEIAAVYRRAHDNALIDLSVADWTPMGENAFRTGIANIRDGSGRIFVQQQAPVASIDDAPRPKRGHLAPAVEDAVVEILNAKHHPPRPREILEALQNDPRFSSVPRETLRQYERTARNNWKRQRR